MGAGWPSQASWVSCATASRSSPASGVDLTTNQPCIAGYASCTTTNLLADGAGGGGGGEGNANGDGGYGGNGGNGGTAVSGQIISLGAQGRDGRAATGTLSRTGQGGFGGGNGDGGSGGRGGGPTHTSKGPNAGVARTNNSSLSFGSAGQGGEGEWRVNATNYGGGGGGGGSWASSDTETVQNVPVISNPDSGGNGSVIATFVGSAT
ncbi:hypothetical protein [Streptomyces sp. NPDC051704]|uniref:hypothetical protein n=1 Tax=Streptomyces sp. NPDC051704 TaxID=3365671 RepID=UPI0037BC2767